MSSPLPPHLTAPTEIHVIISTHSGTHLGQTTYNNTLLPFLDTHSIQYRKHETTSPATITQLTRDIFLPRARSGVQQTIVLLSGDGGVVDFVNALLENDGSIKDAGYLAPTLALIPTGTANALAHSAGVSKDPLSLLTSGTPRHLPLVHVSFSPGARLVVDEGQGREALPEGGLYAAVVVSWGLHASLVSLSDTTEMRKHGIERFKMAAEMLMREEHVYQGNVKVIKKPQGGWGELQYPNQPLETQSNTHSYILASLVSNLEEHFTISPFSKPLDGSVRLIALPALSTPEIMRILGEAYQGGKHVEDPAVYYEEIERLRVEMSETEGQWRVVCIDGKIVELEEGGWVEVEKEDDTREGAVFVQLIC